MSIRIQNTRLKSLAIVLSISLASVVTADANQGGGGKGGGKGNSGGSHARPGGGSARMGSGPAGGRAAPSANRAATPSVNRAAVPSVNRPTAPRQSPTPTPAANRPAANRPTAGAPSSSQRPPAANGNRLGFPGVSGGSSAENRSAGTAQIRSGDRAAMPSLNGQSRIPQSSPERGTGTVPNRDNSSASERSANPELNPNSGRPNSGRMGQTGTNPFNSQSERMGQSQGNSLGDNPTQRVQRPAFDSLPLGGDRQNSNAVLNPLDGNRANGQQGAGTANREQADRVGEFLNLNRPLSSGDQRSGRRDSSQGPGALSGNSQGQPGQPDVNRNQGNDRGKVSSVERDDNPVRPQGEATEDSRNGSSSSGANRQPQATASQDRGLRDARMIDRIGEERPNDQLDRRSERNSVNDRSGTEDRSSSVGDRRSDRGEDRLNRDGENIGDRAQPQSDRDMRGRDGESDPTQTGQAREDRNREGQDRDGRDRDGGDRDRHDRGDWRDRDHQANHDRIDEDRFHRGHAHVNDRPNWVHMDHQRYNHVNRQFSRYANYLNAYNYNTNRINYWNNWASPVRNLWLGNLLGYNYFTPTWFNNHPYNWGAYSYGYAYNSRPWYYWWSAPQYNRFSSWFTWGPTVSWNQPVYYDYGPGGNVYYQNNMVHVNSQPIVSAEEYAQSAAILATVEAPADPNAVQQQDWMPLGTFALVSDPKTVELQHLVQLAVNREGVISGTMFNEADDQAAAIQGRVDKETQRVAFRVDGNDEVVYEVGLYNLTQPEAPVLVHYGTERSEQQVLVRLEAPKTDDNTSDRTESLPSPAAEQR